MFPKPGETVPQAKLQYVQRVPGWDWMVGSGLYMDGIAAQVRAAALKALARPAR
ncbi:MAG: cache domain-containing protein [Comamonadaceae bacterium]|nr:cache domain-containing protein [Comamonadaceae bacterium]